MLDLRDYRAKTPQGEIKERGKRKEKLTTYTKVSYNLQGKELQPSKSIVTTTRKSGHDFLPPKLIGFVFTAKKTTGFQLCPQFLNTLYNFFNRLALG